MCYVTLYMVFINSIDIKINKIYPPLCLLSLTYVCVVAKYVGFFKYYTHICSVSKCCLLTMAIKNNSITHALAKSKGFYKIKINYYLQTLPPVYLITTCLALEFTKISQRCTLRYCSTLTLENK